MRGKEFMWSTLSKFAILVCLITAFVAVPSRGQSSIYKFRFQSARVPVGTVYHYLKTNIDGTHPENITQYVASPNRLEVFKFHPQEEPAALVTAEMDWPSFSVKRLESWHVFKNGERKLVATLSYLSNEKAVEVSLPALRPAPEKTAIRYLPFHVYNFDFGSLNFTFRHLLNPKGSFVIGVADPTFKSEGPLFAYRGEAKVDYLSDEMRNNVATRKYRIKGSGLNNSGGFIWVNKELGHIEDMEIALPDNPAWQTFKLKLLKLEKMNQAEWEAFMKKQF